MAKIFNVEQLRLNGLLLTGSSTGSLHYDGNQLAIGGNAVPTSRKVYLGDGLAFLTGSTYTDTENLSVDRRIILHADETNFAYDGSSPAKVKIADGGIRLHDINRDVLGGGLEGGYYSSTDKETISVQVGSGLLLGSEGGVNVNVSGVKNSMLSGQISNDKLLQITEGAKVLGGAVTLESAGGLDTGANAGLLIDGRGVVSSMIHSDVAGDGLQGGNNGSVTVPLKVGGGSGIHVDANDVNVDSLGVITSMLADNSVTHSKLSTVTGLAKVHGYSVTLHSEASIDTTGVAGGLRVASQGITASHIHADVAGAGIGGGNGTALNIGAGSGIAIETNSVRLAETGVENIHIANNTISAGKLAGSIGLSKLSLTFGDGLTGNSNTDTVAVDLGDTRPGLKIDSTKLVVDETVVRGDSSYGSVGTPQVLSGHYSFKNDVACLSGLVINGDLEVRGDTLITEQNQVNIGDTIVVLNANYTGSAPPDAGIEIERGTQSNVAILFDDDGTNKWQAGVTGDLYRIETKDYSRAYSVEVLSGVNQHKLDFGHTFETVPNVTVSLQHTGKYSTSNPELMGSMISNVYETGVWVDFSANTPHSGYYLNVQAVMT